MFRLVEMPKKTGKNRLFAQMEKQPKILTQKPKNCIINLVSLYLPNIDLVCDFLQRSEI
jgi:hypothetical protein